MKNTVQNEQITHLLSKTDPVPYELINESSYHPLVLVCEHAGQLIPSRLGDLGIDQSTLNSHIGWDIGAEQVARTMAKLLGAPAIIQPYSRLVIDCNRPPASPESIPEVSNDVTVPGNQDLDPGERTARVREIFDPFQSAIDTSFLNSTRSIVLSIHSFTPTLRGNNRPWDIGFLFRNDVDTSARLKTYIQVKHPELTIGMNEPYQVDDYSDWFVPQHGEARSIPHSLIEIRNDHIITAEGQGLWAERLVLAINRYLRET